jgi:regulator of sigma E protease
MLNGSMQVASPIIVERVNENSPASQAGIVAGDALVAVGSTSVETYTDFVLAIAASDLTEMVSLTVERQGEAVETEVFFPNTLSPQLGVVLVGEYVRYGPLEAVPKSFTAAISMIALQSEAMFHLFTGEASTAGVSGPIGIFSIGASAAGSGAGSFVSFLALITVALGLFNLLPVPVLDGGHLIFATYKMLTGKNVSAQMQHRLMVLGMALLLTLIVFASFQDISRLFTKSSP